MFWEAATGGGVMGRDRLWDWGTGHQAGVGPVCTAAGQRVGGTGQHWCYHGPGGVGLVVEMKVENHGPP